MDGGRSSHGTHAQPVSSLKYNLKNSPGGRVPSMTLPYVTKVEPVEVTETKWRGQREGGTKEQSCQSVVDRKE